ncbi:BA14K family protein [Rhodobacteraceae bacterium RKSG542]|uniref:BA14K family protein n=1 Tax=Pseudovibrio flavus TaxID=2529854 RepID=UPI0012BC128D|nr:BA14K family protein [Pseudovibrio flavus]MTI16228.1 BA14K family protein [Pseudovibrio flavus]
MGTYSFKSLAAGTIAAAFIGASAPAQAVVLAKPSVTIGFEQSNIVKVHGCYYKRGRCVPHRHYKPHRHSHKHKHYKGIKPSTAFAIGAMGFIAGAMIASQPKAKTRVTHRTAPKPWTPQWYAYCARKFRSFNADTGLYTTYSGKKRMCR